MKQDYNHLISQLAIQLFSAIVESEEDKQILLVELERLIASILRQVGLQVVTKVFQQLTLFCHSR